jgi:dienelactone hydrolase
MRFHFHLVAAVCLSLCTLSTSTHGQTVDVPFARQNVVLNGTSAGTPLAFTSANPRNFEQIIAGTAMSPIELDGQLFLPAAKAPHPVVILIPGSGGVGAHHIKHAEALLKAGLGVYVLDPFSKRGVTSTSDDQTQISFAASTYDLLSAARMLAALPAVDRQRLGALGYSRGGTAVSLAVSEHLSHAVLGKQLKFRAAMTGWAWCGYQFQNAATTTTAVRYALGDSDNWVAPALCQAQASAIAQRNPQVSVRLFKGGNHGFGYAMQLTEFPNAIKAFNAPAMFMNDNGTFIDWYTAAPMAGADDQTLLRLAAPWVARGVKVGSQAGQSEAFTADMVEFFTKHLKI